MNFSATRGLSMVISSLRSCFAVCGRSPGVNTMASARGAEPLDRENGNLFWDIIGDSSGIQLEYEHSNPFGLSRCSGAILSWCQTLNPFMEPRKGWCPEMAMRLDVICNIRHIIESLLAVRLQMASMNSTNAGNTGEASATLIRQLS